MAVVAAFELDHLVATGVRTDQAQYGHAGFSSTVHEAHHLNARNGLDHHLSGVLKGTRRTKTGALFDRFLQCRDYLRVGMAADGWPPAADVVDVFVSIHVPGVGPLTRSNTIG